MSELLDLEERSRALVLCAETAEKLILKELEISREDRERDRVERS